MSRRFDYVVYDEQAKELQNLFKQEFLKLEDLLMLGVEEGRAKSLALTSLEEAYMWIGKAIRDEQLVRNPRSLDAPQRTHS